MFPLMLWGRSMRNWQLSYVSSTFNWMKLNLLCDAGPIQEFLFMSSYRKYLKSLWHLLSGEKFIFSRKTERNFLVCYVCLTCDAWPHIWFCWSLHIIMTHCFYITILGMRNSASYPERSCQLNKSQGLESPTFQEFLLKNRNRIWSSLLSRSLLGFQKVSLKALN